MRNRTRIRLTSKHGTACCWTIAICFAFAAVFVVAAQSPAPAPVVDAPTANAVILDRVVAVVNNQAILKSDVDNEIRLAVLEPAHAGGANLTPRAALDQLISRALIQQQIHQEDAQAAEPSPAEVDTRLAEIRKDLPVCVRLHCVSDEGWKAFLATYALTPEEVTAYLRNRIQILRFIELRFRQGIRIAPEEIATYYRETLTPQYPAGSAVPPLDVVAPRIEEILLERQVNVLFDDWLNSLRKQGDVEVLDPAFAALAGPSGTRGGGA